MTHFVKDELKNYCKASNMAFNEEVKSMQASGQEVYHFAFGQSPFPIPKCFVDGLKEYAHVNDYLSVAGLPELKKAIADFHGAEDGVVCSDEQVIVGPGSKELIFLTMKVFNGDVIVPTPCWTTYAPQARLAGHEPIVLETGLGLEWKITPSALEKACGKSDEARKLLILTNPGNPTGVSYTEKELENIAETCKKNNVTVLSDEIYGRLDFHGNHKCLAKIYPEGTILASGYSKWASAGGWRVGYVIMPKHMKDLTAAVVSGASHTYSCAPAPMQWAIAQGLKNTEEIKKYIGQCSAILKAVSEFCVRELRSVGVKVVPSDGGYYLMPDFEVCRPGLLRKDAKTSDQMCSLMLKEAKVALMGGTAFLRPEEELTTRFCYVDFNGAKAMEAMESGEEVNSDKFVQDYAPKIAKGVHNLKAFVKEYSHSQ